MINSGVIIDVQFMGWDRSPRPDSQGLQAAISDKRSDLTSGARSKAPPS